MLKLVTASLMFERVVIIWIVTSDQNWSLDILTALMLPLVTTPGSVQAYHHRHIVTYTLMSHHILTSPGCVQHPDTSSHRHIVAFMFSGHVTLMVTWLSHSILLLIIIITLSLLLTTPGCVQSYQHRHIVTYIVTLYILSSLHLAESDQMLIGHVTLLPHKW